MWEALKVRNNLTKTITKKLAIVLFAVAITLFNVGCTPKPVEAIDSPTTENSPVSPEAKPTPPVETRSPRELELEALLEKAPEIEGLTIFIEDNKIIYKNSEGVKSGYYVVKAYYNGEETDGVSLSAEVIESIIKNNLSQGKDEHIPIPVDPSEGQLVVVKFEESIVMNEVKSDFGFVFITSDSKIKLVNSIYHDEEILRYNSSNDMGKTIMTSYMPNKAPSGSISISINKGLLTNPNFNLDSNGDIYRIKMGEVIGEIDETVLLEKLVKISDASIIDKFKLKESEIMKINNSLIFQMALEK